LNIYFFELKHLLKSLLVWTVTIAAVLLLLLKGFYPAMMESRPQMEALFANYPPDVLRAIGMDIDKIFSFDGFYVFTFTYVGLLAAIMAVSLSLQAFSREKRGKCTDFILTKPVRRNEVFIAKSLACLTVIAIFNIVYSVLVGVSVIAETASASLSEHLLLLLLAPFLTQLVFLSLGAAYAVWAKKVRSVSGTATALGFAALLLSGLVEVFAYDWLNYIAPLQYFNPAFILDSGGFEPKLVVTAALIFSAGLVSAYIRYCREDVAAV